MRKHTLLCGFMILTALKARQARQQVPSLPSCYSLEVGTWSGPFPSGVSAEHHPPDKLYLMPDSATERYSTISWRRAGPQNLVPARGKIAGLPVWQNIS